MKVSRGQKLAADEIDEADQNETQKTIGFEGRENRRHLRSSVRGQRLAYIHPVDTFQ
jgi:hypothetical protein